jgi:hypothetical protein
MFGSFGLLVLVSISYKLQMIARVGKIKVIGLIIYLIIGSQDSLSFIGDGGLDHMLRILILMILSYLRE